MYKFFITWISCLKVKTMDRWRDRDGCVVCSAYWLKIILWIHWKPANDLRNLRAT